MTRRLTAICACLMLASGLATGAWWLTIPSDPPGQPPAELPVPPFPPRITEGAAYESCLATLASDPASAATLAETWAADGGGDGAVHCHGLALIAMGKPADGAALLEQLAHDSPAPPLARASVLGQATQARLMVAQAAQAAADASLALTLSPADTELLIMRATAEDTLGRFGNAVDDVTAALELDAGRADALVLRAGMRRKLNQIDLAQADVSRALALDPDDPDALLERGILRQRTGDPAGARADRAAIGSWPAALIAARRNPCRRRGQRCLRCQRRHSALRYRVQRRPEAKEDQTLGKNCLHDR